MFSRDCVNYAANLFCPVLNICSLIPGIDDLYTFATVSILLPLGKYHGFLPPPRPAPRPAAACSLISLSGVLRLSWTLIS